MTGRVFLLVAAFLAAGLAGCADDPPGVPVPDPGLVAVAATELVPGGFYAFDHPGGELAFSTRGNSSAEVVLYGGDDRRIGRIGVGDQDTSGRFVLDDVPAGELVVEVLELEGDDDGLDIRSAGQRVRGFERLPVHVERHLLVQVDFSETSLGGLLPFGGGPVDENKDLQLRRAPSSLRLLYLGSHSDLSVVVSGSSGPVLQAESSGGVPATGPYDLYPVPGQQVFTENIRDGRLSAQVSAESFQGVLFLEARTFSRARPVEEQGMPTPDVPRFTYGPLPDQPVSFQVHDEAENLYLFYEGTGSEGICRGSVEDPPADADGSCSEAALVALFDADDRRVATVRVRFNETVAIPVDAAGEWVAVLLAGEATLGASRVPADFELHPLDVRTAQVPQAAAGENGGNYGQATSEATVDGVLFRITGVQESPRISGFGVTPLDYRCASPSLIAYQGGEAIAAWGIDEDQYDPGTSGPAEPTAVFDPNALLDGTGLTLVHDDFGPECDRMTLSIEGYSR